MQATYQQSWPTAFVSIPIEIGEHRPIAMGRSYDRCHLCKLTLDATLANSVNYRLPSVG
jgi:hypothetical protein